MSDIVVVKLSPDVEIISPCSTLPLNNLLTPHTNYFFQVVAVNIAGPSVVSESTGIITTKMDRPEGPPRNVSMRAQNYSTLILNWEVGMQHIQ